MDALLLDQFKCMYCTRICEIPYECSFCNKLACFTCVEDPNNNNCKNCEKPREFRDSKFAKRIIGTLPTQCEFCDEKFTFSEKHNHTIHCPNRQIICIIDKCEFKGGKAQLIEHINTAHVENLVEFFDKELSKSNHEMNLFGNHKNDKGFTVSRGIGGKFYCGKTSDVRCRCCDGNCGIGAGCQCLSCLRFEKKFYNFGSKQMINHSGVLAELVGDKFYCGCDPSPFSKYIRYVSDSDSSICKPGNSQCCGCQAITVSSIIDLIRSYK